MSGWYYIRDGKQVGPAPESRLRELARAGGISISDYVWHDGLPDWVTADKIPNLFSQTPPPPPVDAVNPYRPPGTANLVPPGLTIESVSTAVIHAGFWLRVAAGIVDRGVLWILGFVFGFLFGRVAIGFWGFDRKWLIPAAIGGGLIVELLYYAIMLGSEGNATVGMRAIGLRATDTSHLPIGFGRACGWAFFRTLFFFAALGSLWYLFRPQGIVDEDTQLGLIFAVVVCMGGFLMIGITNTKQGLHDFLTSVLVIRAR